MQGAVGHAASRLPPVCCYQLREASPAGRVRCRGTNRGYGWGARGAGGGTASREQRPWLPWRPLGVRANVATLASGGRASGQTLHARGWSFGMRIRTIRPSQGRNAGGVPNPGTGRRGFSPVSTPRAQNDRKASVEPKQYVDSGFDVSKSLSAVAARRTLRRRLPCGGS